VPSAPERAPPTPVTETPGTTETPGMEKPRRVKPVRTARTYASLTAHDKQDGYFLACQATVRGAVRVDA
jgi:hypothetical protein